MTLAKAFMALTALLFLGQGCSNPMGLAGTKRTSYTVAYNGNGNSGGSVPVDGNNYVIGAAVTVNAASPGVIWQTDNTSAVSVDSSGNITACASLAAYNAGMTTANITAISVSDPTKSTTFAVTVVNSVTFGCTGAPQQWTVPSYVTKIEIMALGGAGGEMGSCPAGGGMMKADFMVNSGTVFYLYVGGSGGYDGADFWGWNGGLGLVGSRFSSSGGATDVRIGGTALTNRVMVVGGGGGSGYSSGSSLWNIPGGVGAGRWVSGSNGVNGGDGSDGDLNGRGGSGGTLTGGGVGGYSDIDSTGFDGSTLAMFVTIASQTYICFTGNAGNTWTILNSASSPGTNGVDSWGTLKMQKQ